MSQSPTLEITWHEDAVKELSKLDRGTIRRVLDKVERLAFEPFPPQARALTGFTGTYRLRVGDYRVIYSPVDRELIILILSVGHRRELYEKLRRSSRGS